VLDNIKNTELEHIIREFNPDKMQPLSDLETPPSLASHRSSEQSKLVILSNPESISKNSDAISCLEVQLTYHTQKKRIQKRKIK
jgi:hypothetical protein